MRVVAAARVPINRGDGHMQRQLAVTEMFREMIAQGQITPATRSDNIEDLRMPGELPYMPTIATYGTYRAPVSGGTEIYAELESRT